MKTKMLYNKLWLLLAISFSFTTCRNDKQDNSNPVENIPELKLEKQTIEIEVNKSKQINIIQGGGEYSAFASNPDIINVELKNNVIKIDAIKYGKSSAIISDKNSQYKELAVLAFFKKIILETENIQIQMPLGHKKIVKVPILQGNGGYKATTNNDILSVSFEKDKVVITALKEGQTSIVITDSYGLTLTIPVEITSTTIPYNEKELAEIMANDKDRYIFNNINMYKANSIPLNTIENGKNLYGWDARPFFDESYFEIYFKGDKTVGKKTESILSIKFASIYVNEEPIDLEIIKNNGNKIWVIYSYVKPKKLNFGHFCQNINP